MELPEQPPAAAQAPEGAGPASEEAGEAVLAGILERFLAYAVDGLLFLFGAYFTLRMAINQGVVAWNAGSYRAWMLGWTALYVLYHAVMNSGGRVPLGKKLLGLQVLTTAGEPLSFGRSLTRAIGYLIDAVLLQLGFAWALLDPQGRAWHDYLAGTLVVETSEKPAAVRAGVSLVSLGLLCACLFLTVKTYFPGLLKPGASGPSAEIQSARDGLQYVGELEDYYHSRTGRYTDNVKELLAQTGVKPTEFRDNLLARIDADGFGIKAGPDGYIIVGSARDNSKTQLTYRGPKAKSP